MGRKPEWRPGAGYPGPPPTWIQGLLSGIVWDDVRSLPGGSGFVPDALLRLMAADSDAAAEEAYWELDNRVVVQGGLFEVAQFVIAPLLCALQDSVTLSAKPKVVDLLVEIALGEPDESELAGGNSDLGERCRAELRHGLWQFYGLLGDADSSVRIGAILVLQTIETDRSRLARVLNVVSVMDPDPQVRRRAIESRGSE